MFFILFVGIIGIFFSYKGIDFDILLKWLIFFIDFLYKNLKNFVDWYEFLINVVFLVIFIFLGIFIVFFFYKFVYLDLQNLNLLNLFEKNVFNKKVVDYF